MTENHEETQETSPYDRLRGETDTGFLARAIMTLARVTEEQGGAIAARLAEIDDTLDGPIRRAIDGTVTP